MAQKDLLKKIKTYFVNKPHVLAVYLYGSFAKIEEKEGSDIDLAVLFDNKVKDSLYLRFQYESDLEKILGRKVEIQELNICRIDFAYRVLQEGVLVNCQNNSARVQFETKTMQNYFDLKPLFEEYYHVLEQQSLKGDFHA